MQHKCAQDFWLICIWRNQASGHAPDCMRRRIRVHKHDRPLFLTRSVANCTPSIDKIKMAAISQGFCECVVHVLFKSSLVFCSTVQQIMMICNSVLFTSQHQINHTNCIMITWPSQKCTMLPLFMENLFLWCTERMSMFCKFCKSVEWNHWDISLIYVCASTSSWGVLLPVNTMSLNIAEFAD